MVWIMSSLKAKAGCFFIVILIQMLKVSCENVTTPTVSSEDLMTSSLPLSVQAMTSSGTKTEEGESSATRGTTQSKPSEAQVPATKPPAKTASPPVAHTTHVDNKPATEHPTTHHGEPTNHSKPTHHGEPNNTHGKKMGHPHEPPEVDASTQEKVDGGWQISVTIVCSLVGGIVAFVVVMVLKSNREMRHVRLREEERKRKRSIAKEKSRALKAMKTEEPKPRVEKKKEEHRLSFLKPDPEESIPLLELHIMDGEAPVLSGYHEKQDTQHTEPTTAVKDSKPILEENGNMPADTCTVDIA